MSPAARPPDASTSAHRIGASTRGRATTNDRPPSATTGEAIRAVSRLLSAAATADGPAGVERALVREARAFADVAAALLVRVDEADRSFVVAAGDPEPMPRATTPLASVPAISDA